LEQLRSRRLASPPARQLAQLVGDPPDVPVDIRRKYVTTLVYVFLTNGYGESWDANTIYVELIRNFDPAEARVALSLFTNRDIVNRLHQRLSEKKFRELLDIIDSKIVSRPRRELLEALKAVEDGSMHAASRDRKIVRLYETASRAARAASR